MGCAHSGICNTLQYIADIARRPAVAVIGGLHLANATPRRLDETVKFLSGSGVNWLAPVHCTGAQGMNRLRAARPEIVVDCRAGSHFNFSDNPLEHTS